MKSTDHFDAAVTAEQPRIPKRSARAAATPRTPSVSLGARSPDRRRLGSLERFLLGLVALDAVSAAVALLVVVILPGGSAVPHELAWCGALLIAWVATMIWFRGFSWVRETDVKPFLSVCAAMGAAGVALLASLPAQDVGAVGTPMVFILALTALDIAGRAAIARGHKRRIVTVVMAGGDPAPRLRNVERSYVTVTGRLAANPHLLVKRVQEAAVSFGASAVELPDSVPIDGELTRELGWVLRKQHIKLRMIVIERAIASNRVDIHVEGRRSLLEVAAPYPALATRLAKRAIDIAVSATLIVLLSPVLAALALLVKFSSPGPVLYGQDRVGRDGRLFRILKFRSMIPDADAQLRTLLKEQGTGDVPLFKVKDDPRVTRVGRIMRRSSLDELPQLFNVLAGSMSLVGPRPQRPAEVVLYGGEASQRLGVLPGMTGMWQVSGRSRLGWEQAMALDIYYARNWSIVQDLKILLRTVSAVVRGDGAE